MHLRTAELLLGDVLVDRHLDQRRTAEEGVAGVLDEDRVVAHAGQVGAPGGGRAEHHRDGRDPGSGELGQATELLATRDEDVGLLREVRTTGLDQGDHRQGVDLGDVEGAQHLLDRGGREAAAPDAAVVARSPSPRRPQTSPMPVTRPPPTGSSVPQPARAESSRKEPCGSSSTASRSRTVSLPRSWCRATARWSPSWTACSKPRTCCKLGQDVGPGTLVIRGRRVELAAEDRHEHSF